jgi:hypothetical protein
VKANTEVVQASARPIRSTKNVKRVISSRVSSMVRAWLKDKANFAALSITSEIMTKEIAVSGDENENISRVRTKIRETKIFAQRRL